MSYKESGVDISAGNALVSSIKEDVLLTHGPNVLGSFGGFAGMFKLSNQYKSPILVSCTDGVGTKVALAQESGILSGIGQDLVAMCVNDLITCGADPLFFLDYYSSSKLNIEDAAYVIKGIAKACRDVNCALIGGETAEMPGHYVGKNFDLAGFAVGCVDEDEIIDHRQMQEGNVLIGIESSGPHSNGFSLIRKILQDNKPPKDSHMIEKLLQPTYLYPPLISEIRKHHDIRGIAHITGGGITENVSRIIPDGLAANICKCAWDQPEVFRWLQTKGELTSAEMFEVFNCGIGMVLVIDISHVDTIRQCILDNGYKSWVIGNIKMNENSNLKVQYEET